MKTKNNPEAKAWSFNIHFFHCGSAGLQEHKFYYYLILILLALRSLTHKIHFSFNDYSTTVGLREQAINVTQLWLGILKPLPIHFGTRLWDLAGVYTPAMQARI